ncbi:uroporphyrinogen-III synthase [uncultured Roseobacter sp.]|uniref:uroporphyrinogen-III synthase n=1 Tax=uncultured Roseobacter sp. TaxID=114847 RepID=UPI00261D8433|nr:uroporphyrinogen-III synthase [uncultured Roseobacter sp.]
MDTKAIPLIMTRPAPANARFVAALPDALRQRMEVIESPLMQITAVGEGCDLGPEDGAVFTSANGVSFAPAGAGRFAFCVGHRTTEMALNAGWQAHFCGETADALVTHLIQSPPRRPLVHFSGRHTRGAVAERLQDANITAARQVVYDQILIPPTSAAQALIESENPVLVPLFSPRAAAWFAQLYPAGGPIHAMALSPAVAAPLRDLRLLSLDTAARPDAAAMIDCLEKVVQRVSLG